MLLFIIALTLITLVLPYIEFSSDNYSFSNVYDDIQRDIAGKLAHRAAIKAGTPKSYWYEYDGEYERVWYRTFKQELNKRSLAYKYDTYSL